MASLIKASLTSHPIDEGLQIPQALCLAIYEGCHRFIRLRAQLGPEAAELVYASLRSALARKGKSVPGMLHDTVKAGSLACGALARGDKANAARLRKLEDRYGACTQASRFLPDSWGTWVTDHIYGK